MPDENLTQHDLADLATTCGEIELLCRWARKGLGDAFEENYPENQHNILVALRSLQTAAGAMPDLIAKVEARRVIQ